MTGQATAAPDEWRHLDLRVVWVNGIILLFSLASGVVQLWFYPDGDLWPLLLAAIAGVIDTSVNLTRWFTTRYRVTAERVEVRSGLLRRESRGVPRDRIRSVDTTAKLRHRVGRLRIVHVGAGEERIAATVKLDALSRDAAVRLREELIPTRLAELARAETPIARVRWQWIFFAMFQFWVVLAAAIFLNACYWALKAVDVDLLGIADTLAGELHLSTATEVVLGLLLAIPLGGLVLGAEFISKYWNFELLRTTEGGGALVTRQGLFSTQTVHREERRIRGIHVHEPLALAWLHLAQATVVMTGTHRLRNETSHILPRCPVDEVRRVAREVLPGGHHPLEARLQRHPLGALRKRLLEATTTLLVVAALCHWLGDTAVVPTSTWVYAIALVPFAWVVAAVSYTWLGHGLAGPYVVFRVGALNKLTVALETRAIAGWRLRQTIFQRYGRRITVGIPTSAGERYYHCPDMGIDQAVELISRATPDLAAQILAPEHPAAERRRGS